MFTVCARGDLALAQRLVAEFGLTADDLSAGADGCVFFEACEYGHLAVAQWLAAEGLVPRDVHAREHRLLELACGGRGERGGLQLVQWLVDHFFTSRLEDDVAGCLRALREAAAAGRLDAARWLAEKYQLQADTE